MGAMKCIATGYKLGLTALLLAALTNDKFCTEQNTILNVKKISTSSLTKSALVMLVYRSR